jgi:hypothetical protein
VEVERGSRRIESRARWREEGAREWGRALGRGGYRRPWGRWGRLEVRDDPDMWGPAASG